LLSALAHFCRLACQNFLIGVTKILGGHAFSEMAGERCDKGASFLLNGIKPANDTAVIGLNLQAQKATGLSYGVRLDSQVGAGTTVLEATGNVAYRW